MDEAEALKVFPRRPLAVKMSVREMLSIAFGALVGAASLGGIVFFLLSFAPGIVSDARVYESGVPVAVVGADGKCRMRIGLLPLTTCDYRVTYDAGGGRVKTAEAGALLFGVPGEEGETVAKLDPRDDSAVAVSWFAERITERWLTLIGVCLGFALLGVVLIVGAWKSVREYRLYRRLARQPRPIAATVTDVKQVSSPNYARQYAYSYDFDGRRIDRKQLFKVKPSRNTDPATWVYDEPLFLDARGSRALALIDEAGAALLINQSLHPLQLTAEERERISRAAPNGRPRA